MKRLGIFLLSIFLCCQGVFGADYKPQKANPSSIRIIPVTPTPQPDNIQIRITFPKPQQVLFQNPVGMQLRLSGFPLGVMSDFERKQEVYNDPNGQSLLVFIDNHHPLEIYKSFVDSLDDSNLYYDLILNEKIPFKLEEGMHIIRTFPARSFGESLKGKGCFKAGVFYFKNQTNNLNVDLSAPYLTYNEPLETLLYKEGQALLLDFYICNTQLSRDGYKVKLTIDHTIERILTSWVPYYIRGLKRGAHTIRLQLLNEKNEVEPGIFNDVTRRITID